jgi:hypothetical protein
MIPNDQAQKSEVHETTEDAASAKTNPDIERATTQPGEARGAGDMGASREIKADDIREPEEKLLGSADDESDFGGPIDLDIPPT